MELSPRSIATLSYLAASIYVTVVVGRRLHRQGCPFLADLFPDRLDVGRAINNLLLTGYYLLNIAFAALMLRQSAGITDWATGTAWCSGRLGVVLMTLGLMHFTNVITLLLIHPWLTKRQGQSPALSATER